MNCNQTQRLLHGYMDGELDLVTALAIEQHLQACVSCTQTYQQQRALQSAFRANTLYAAPPAPLQRRIHSALRQANRQADPPRWDWRWLSAAAAMAVALLIIVPVSWRLYAGLTQPPVGSVAQEVLASHVRALITNHLTDVTSSDRHTVKPWFDGKLDFAPTVEDFAAQGFPLIGGRLDYLDGRPVAALVYQSRRHPINLFVWPASGETTGTAVQSATLQGYHLFSWQQAGMHYWAVSDVNADELKVFVRLLQTRLAPPTPS